MGFVCACTGTWEYPSGEQLWGAVNFPSIFAISLPLSNEVAPKGLRTRTEQAGVRISYCLTPPAGALPVFWNERSEPAQAVLASCAPQDRSEAGGGRPNGSKSLEWPE